MHKIWIKSIRHSEGRISLNRLQILCLLRQTPMLTFCNFFRDHRSLENIVSKPKNLNLKRWFDGGWFSYWEMVHFSGELLVLFSILILSFFGIKDLYMSFIGQNGNNLITMCKKRFFKYGSLVKAVIDSIMVRLRWDITGRIEASFRFYSLLFKILSGTSSDTPSFYSPDIFYIFPTIDWSIARWQH